ncbi:MAG TPA: C40 family peptidase [Myxococcota bacterium]|nr:C40 family peptidase [Myxococcota bacterium]
MLAATAIAAVVACASPPHPAPGPPPAPELSRAQRQREAVVSAAEGVVGRPYRRGASGPANFDCSGLVAWSFAHAGIDGLPRKAADLERASRPIALASLEPGDLLFFRIDGRKTSHVAIYVGERSFVHAPSRGKRVERVDFDHVYWGPRLARAGRILD